MYSVSLKKVVHLAALVSLLFSGFLLGNDHIVAIDDSLLRGLPEENYIEDLKHVLIAYAESNDGLHGGDIENLNRDTYQMLWKVPIQLNWNTYSEACRRILTEKMPENHSSYGSFFCLSSRYFENVELQLSFIQLIYTPDGPEMIRLETTPVTFATINRYLNERIQNPQDPEIPDKNEVFNNKLIDIKSLMYGLDRIVLVSIPRTERILVRTESTSIEPLYNYHVVSALSTEMLQEINILEEDGEDISGFNNTYRLLTSLLNDVFNNRYQKVDFDCAVGNLNARKIIIQNETEVSTNFYQVLLPYSDIRAIEKPISESNEYWLKESAIFWDNIFLARKKIFEKEVVNELATANDLEEIDGRQILDLDSVDCSEIAELGSKLKGRIQDGSFLLVLSEKIGTSKILDNIKDLTLSKLKQLLPPDDDIKRIIEYGDLYIYFLGKSTDDDEDPDTIKISRIVLKGYDPNS